MKNYLKYINLFLTLVMALSLTACGGGTTAVPDSIEGLTLDPSVEYDYSGILDDWMSEDGVELFMLEYDDGIHYEFYGADYALMTGGKLQYVEKYDSVYFYDEQDGVAHRCWLGEDDTLHIDAFGTFSRMAPDGDLTGSDWRTTGIVRGDGTITRGGKDTFVLVCVNKVRSTFYYDSESQTAFDWVDYPPALAERIDRSGDVWEMFRDIDFADLNGDGNSDVTMKFHDGGSELAAVWFWDGENEAFVYQPEESSLTSGEGALEQYRERIERFYILVSDPDRGMDGAEDGESGVLESAQGMGKDALRGMGYLIEDLSGDGAPELVVGALAEYGGQINALYTLSDGRPQLVLESWSRSSYTYVGNGSFYFCGSNSAVESGQGIFTLSRDGRELNCRKFYFTYAEGGDWDNAAVYANTTGSWEPEESERGDMTLEEYSELLSDSEKETLPDFWGLDAGKVQLELTPFSEWGAGSNKAADGD